MQRQKVAKIILIITFIPYLYLLGYSLYQAITGYEQYTWVGHYIGTIYGAEAFFEVVFWHGLALTIIPVLPICLLYQVIYLIFSIVRKHKKKRETGGVKG